MKNKNEEAIKLAEEILKNIELEELSWSSIVMKCLRLARLIGNQPVMKALKYELSGYPMSKDGKILPEVWGVAKAFNRVFSEKDKDGIYKEYMFPQTMNELESYLDSLKKQLETASHPIERHKLPKNIMRVAGQIGKLKAAYYSYALRVYYGLKFGAIIEEIFNRIRKKVDVNLQKICPDALKKFITAYENLKTGEDENWANAVHSCRRILKDVADSLYPPSEEEVALKSGEKVRLNEEHYILRLIEFIKSKSGSETFDKVVGSTLDHMANRINAIYKATTKGTHFKVEKEEAEVYVIHTYLLIGNILSLVEQEGKLKFKTTPSKK